MKSITERAYAKINLGLDILGRREDGYHIVDMIMQTVGIYDEVELTLPHTQEADTDAQRAVQASVSGVDSPAVSMTIQQTSYGEELAADGDNLCIRAARALLPADAPDIHIALKKNIPIAAGMAGGSTDAAAVLRGINRLLGLGLSAGELARIGETLGADIPYCIGGGCVRAEGIGERLTGIAADPGWTLLIAKPPVAVSTAEVYHAYDDGADTEHPDIGALSAAITADDVYAACRNMGNVLEPVTERLHPVIGEIESEMVSRGAIRAMMTGSGPTVFGIFADRMTCEDAAGHLRESGLCPEIFVTRTIRPEY